MQPQSSEIHTIRPSFFIGFQQDSLKRTLWKEFTFTNLQFADPWNTTPTATSRKDEPTNPCKARKKVTCNIQCITKWNRRIEYFLAECWNNYIILYVSVLKLLCNLTCWIFYCWMLKWLTKSRCLRVEITQQFVAQFLACCADPKDKGTHAH